MTTELLNLDSLCPKGKYKNKTIREIIEKERQYVLELVKKGYSFEEEVYEAARYVHTVRDVKFIQEYCDKPKCNKEEIKLAKDTKSLKEILKSLSTIENTYENAPIEEMSDEEFENQN